EFQRAASNLPAPARPLALRYVVLAGDALDVARLTPWAEAARAPVLVSTYGISETAGQATHGVVAPGDESTRPRSPIGRGLPGCRVYVLDGRLRPVPVGVRGEIYLAGTGLARGYLR